MLSPMECIASATFGSLIPSIAFAISGPSGGAPSQFGDLRSFSISQGRDTEEARQFVEFLMSDGYVDWLALAPEGKSPTRLGNAVNGSEYADAWGSLEAGVDRDRLLSEVYDDATIEALSTSSDTIRRWAFYQDQGELGGALLTEAPIPNALLQALDGSISPQEATAQAEADVEEILATLE